MERIKKQSIVRLYGKTVVFKLVCVAIGFINSILINRCLGVALRGEYTTITNWASLLQLFLNLGVGTAYPAYKRRHPDTGKKIFSTLTIIVAIVYLGIIVISFPILSTQLRFTVVIAYLTIIENLLIFIAIVEDVAKRNAINIATSFMHTLVLLFIFIMWKRNLGAVLFAIILDHMILCFSFIIMYRMKEIDFSAINRTVLKEVFIVAIPAMLMNLLMYLNYHADVLFLSEMTKNNVEVGLYGTAVTLGNMLWIIPDAFKDILYNSAAKKDNPNEVIAAIFCNLLMCVVILCGFVLFGKWFLNFMYGNEFVEAYPLVLMLFLGTLPMVLYKLIHPIYIANGKTKVVVVLLSIAVVANFVGNIVLIPKYNGMGAAIASVFSYSICGIAFYLKFKKDYSIQLKKSLATIVIKLREKM